jgi:hypothetical protein
MAIYAKRIGNYGFVVRATLSRGLHASDQYASTLEMLNRFAPLPEYQVNPLPALGEAIADGPAEANDEMARRVEAWIRQQPDYAAD